MNLGDDTRRQALARWISSQLEACSLDELRVLEVRLERFARARAKYGPLDLSTDSRDFEREAAEENVDRAFYRDCALISKQDQARRELEDAAKGELFAFVMEDLGGEG